MKTTTAAIRSLLFVPGDRPDRFAKAASAGADAVILDLEDAVARSAKSLAREAVAAFLNERPSNIRLFVRVNAGGNEARGRSEEDADLAMIAAARPDGVLVPKVEGQSTMRRVLRKLDRLGEQELPLLPIVAETPLGVIRTVELSKPSPRLLGFTWGAEDLAASLVAATRDEEGRFTPVAQQARNGVLLAAAAASVPAFETVFANTKDLEGCRRQADDAARHGFTGMLAIHPAQVGEINRAFEIGEAALERARSIVAAFAADPGVGALTVEGEMMDAAHLRQARDLLIRKGLSDRR